MQLKLKVIGGSHHGEEISVTGPKFFIGRDRDCQLQLKSDVISRHHCALIFDEGYVGVRDFNSKNGTFVVKMFQGEGFDEVVKDFRAAFKVVKFRKPSASRSRSREVYAVCQEKFGTPGPAPAAADTTGKSDK